jgi:prepilin-type processing-associated H-X9-DG protein
LEDEHSGVSPLRENQVAVPSDMFATGDTQIMTAGIVNSTGNLAGDGNLNLCCGINQTIFSYSPRHGKDYNVVFCDAHVTRINPLTFFNPTNTAAPWNNDHQAHFDLWILVSPNLYY